MTTSTKIPTSATGSDRFTKLLAFGQQKLTSLLEAIRSDTERGRTQRAALTVFFIRVISAAVAFASQVVLARWMGGHEYGIFVFVWVWVLILSVISSAGLNISMMRFLPQYTEEKKFGLLRGLLFGGRLITFGFACVLTAMAIILLYAFPGLVQSHYVLPAYIVLVCMPVIVLTDVQDCIGRAYSWMRLALIPPYILRPLLILISMCGAAVLGLPMEATTAAGCAVIACFLTYAAQTVILQRRLKAARSATERGPEMRTAR